MKDSKTYSQKLKSLYRSLKRSYGKPQNVTYDEPVDALVYAVVSEKLSEAAANSALKKFRDYFVDWNDLRVSRPEEVIELLGQDNEDTRTTATSLTTILKSIFTRYNTVSLQMLKKIGKRPAKQVLEKMACTTNFTVSYIMLTSLQAHAIPLTNRMVQYLKTNEIVHPDAREDEIEGFLARQISASNAYEFYALLRRHSESRKGRTRKKTTRKTKKKAEKEAKK